jgi:hypothetical protein
MGAGIRNRVDKEVASFKDDHTQEEVATTAMQPSCTSGWTAVVIQQGQSIDSRKKRVVLVDPISLQELYSSEVEANDIYYIQCYCQNADKIVSLVVNKTYSSEQWQRLVIWNVKTDSWSTICPLTINDFSARAVSNPSGTRLLISERDRFRLWNVETYSWLFEFSSMKGFSADACFSGDDKLIATKGHCVFGVWDTASGLNIGRFDTMFAVSGRMITGNADGRLCGKCSNVAVGVWEICTGKLVFSFARQYIKDASFVSDDSVVVVFDSGVAAWKISDRTMMFEQNCRTYYDLEGTFRFTAPVNHVRNTVAIMVYPYTSRSRLCNW